MVDRLFRANSRPPAAGPRQHEDSLREYFHDGIRVGDRAKLVALAEEIGLTGAAEALASQRFADAVRADEAEAKKLGIGGVPFFLVDGKKAVSGAEAVDVLLQALG